MSAGITGYPGIIEPYLSVVLKSEGPYPHSVVLGEAGVAHNQRRILCCVPLGQDILAVNTLNTRISTYLNGFFIVVGKVPFQPQLSNVVSSFIGGTISSFTSLLKD